MNLEVYLYNLEMSREQRELVFRAICFCIFYFLSGMPYFEGVLLDT